VNATHSFESWGTKPLLAGTAETIARGLGDAAWQRLSAGESSKGERTSAPSTFPAA
jgi:hypothetical protein